MEINVGKLQIWHMCYLLWFSWSLFSFHPFPRLFSVLRFFPLLLYLQWVEDNGSSVIFSWLSSERKTLNLPSLCLGYLQGAESIIILTKYCPHGACSTGMWSGREMLFLPLSGFCQSFSPNDKVHDLTGPYLLPFQVFAAVGLVFFEIMASEEGS